MPRAALIVTVLVLASALAAACSSGGGGGPATGPGGAAPTTPQPDGFAWTGNTRMTVPAVRGLRSNDPPKTVIVAADAVTAAGGTVAVDLASGAFTYDPPLGLQNFADTFTYTAEGFAPVTVTIELRERVWWVRNDPVAASPDGSDDAPFATLAAAEAASDAGDTLFVFAGNAASPTDAGQDSGIALKDGQRLIGEGVGLRVEGVPLVDPFPKARISNRALVGVGAGPVIRLATGNEVAGFAIDAAFNEGVLAVGGTGHDVHDNAITVDPAGGTDGIRLLAVTGENVVARNTITGAPRFGIALANDEDQARATVAPTPIAAAVTLIRNAVSASGQGGISVRLDGAGTDVALGVLTNAVTGSGGAGIDVSALGPAGVASVLSRNKVSLSASHAVRLSADATSSHRSFVANNALSASGVADDFRASTAAGGTAAACLELLNNRNAPNAGDPPLPPSTFAVEHPDAGGTFELFEGTDAIGNDTSVDRQGAGDFVDVLAGACGVALDGAALFLANCAECHKGNGLGGTVAVVRDVTGATATRIRTQLTVNGSMNRIRLTEQEIQAIAGALAP